MTAEDFRHLALSFPGVVESAHMKHPDFRMEGRVFASLGYPDEEHGMVSLTPEQQQWFLRRDPAVFQPCAGAWGKKGSTTVRLPAVSSLMLGEAMEEAVKNILTKKSGKKGC